MRVVLGSQNILVSMYIWTYPYFTWKIQTLVDISPTFEVTNISRISCVARQGSSFLLFWPQKLVFIGVCMLSLYVQSYKWFSCCLHMEICIRWRPFIASLRFKTLRRFVLFSVINNQKVLLEIILSVIKFHACRSYISGITEFMKQRPICFWDSQVWKHKFSSNILQKLVLGPKQVKSEYIWDRGATLLSEMKQTDLTILN